MSVLPPTKSPDGRIHRMSERRMFGIKISAKTSMIIQILLVWSLVVMEIFLEEVRLDYILPLYTLFWIMAYSDISKAVKTEQN